MENNNPYVSVVIPTYNEEVRKEKMKAHLESIGEYFKSKSLTYEILIALDGPKDNTAQLVKEYANNWSLYLRETDMYSSLLLFNWFCINGDVAGIGSGNICGITKL